MSPPRTWLREPLDLTHLDPHLYGYETVVRAKRIGIQPPQPPLSPGDRAWMGYQIGRAGQQERQRLLIGHRTDLLAQAGPTRRTGGILDAGTGGARGVSTGIDWQQKLGSLRPSQRSFKLPYQGPNTLGPRPQHATLVGQKVWEHVQQQKQIQARLSGGMQRLGSCWTTTVQRMEQGWRNAYGASLLAGRTQEEKLVFDAIDVVIADLDDEAGRVDGHIRHAAFDRDDCIGRAHGASPPVPSRSPVFMLVRGPASFDRRYFFSIRPYSAPSGIWNRRT